MPRTDLVQSVLRSLDLLEIVARSEHGATLQELAAALGVAPPTAHNLARTLLARGYLGKSAPPVRYSLGPACFDLVAAQSRRTLLREAGLALRELAAAFPAASLIYAEAVGAQVVVVVRVGPERPGVIQDLYREPLAPYSAAASLVYQAFCTETERQAFRARHPFEELGAHYWGEPAALEAFLADVRREGQAYLAPGVAAPTLRCAVPVSRAGGGLAGMVGLSLAPTAATAIAVPRTLELLKAVAARLERRAASPGGD